MMDLMGAKTTRLILTGLQQIYLRAGDIVKQVNRIDDIERKVNKLMADNQDLATQLQAAADGLQALETQIETSLAQLSTDQKTAIDDLKAWIGNNAASQINPAVINELQGIATKFQAVQTTLATLDEAAKAGDPGAPPSNPVNTGDGGQTPPAAPAA